MEGLAILDGSADYVFVPQFDFKVLDLAGWTGNYAQVRPVMQMESSPLISGSNSCFGSKTESMRPGGSESASREHVATRNNASSSEKTPAKQAATHSPRL